MRLFILIAVATMLNALSGYAQPFEEKVRLELSVNLEDIQLQWLSIDKDLHMDIVVTGKAPDGNWKIIPFRNVDGQSFEMMEVRSTDFDRGYFQIGDWNQDNLLDLVVLGEKAGSVKLVVFTNQGDFTFLQEDIHQLNEFTNFIVADLNNDGQSDVITYDSPESSGLDIFQNTNIKLIARYDSVGLQINDVKAFDLNNDGMQDLVVSGRNNDNSPFANILYNKSNFKFDIVPLEEPVVGKLAIADLNEDGQFDLFVVGSNNEELTVNQIWINDLSGFTKFRSNEAPLQAAIFVGDIDSDGLVDQIITGTSSGIISNQVIYFDESTNVLPNENLITQSYGDLDSDGDIDLAQIILEGNQKLIVLSNTTSELNSRPDIPTNSFAISTFGKTFIYWDNVIDDKTDAASITYDVWLAKNDENVLSPSFNIDNKRRSILSHGNAGANNSMIINSLTDNRYFYEIQAIDNAYNGSYEVGTGGVLPCFDLKTNYLQVCKGDAVQLKAPEPAFWFSTSTGFIENVKDLSFEAVLSDTIFSFVPQGTDCSKNQVWVIGVNSPSGTESEVIFACEGASLNLGISPGWMEVSWNIDTTLSTQDSISYTLLADTTINVTARNDGICVFKKSFELRVSQPTLEVNGDAFKILKGNSVQLSASGSGASYSWQPPNSINNSEIPNPIASPTTTTTYTVTSSDSVGCIASSTILVQVEENAFVPSLFTPNSDGKNDILIIYGLTDALDFRFQIFNREGNVVYETDSIIQATSTGWDGADGGKIQSSGMYVWKISGQTPTGQVLQLNGKTSGSILLVR